MKKKNENDAYSIAWFKLAECVARREKERAFAVFRLLSHSIDDAAVVVHLEADLLFAFKDDVAITFYQRAVDLYQCKKRFGVALGVCNHLLELGSCNDWAKKKKKELCKELGVSG